MALLSESVAPRSPVALVCLLFFGPHIAVTRGRYTALTQDHGFHGVGMHEFTRGDLVVSGGGALSHYGDRWMGLGIGGCGIVDAGIGVQNSWSSVGKVFRKAKEK